MDDLKEIQGRMAKILDRRPELVRREDLRRAIKEDRHAARELINLAREGHIGEVEEGLELVRDSLAAISGLI